MAKRFFQLDDGGCRYSVVATDLQHAKQVLRDSGVEFGDPSRPLDEAEGLVWSEIPSGRADRILADVSEMDEPLASRVRVPLRVGLIPLSECELGEWFSSEW